MGKRKSEQAGKSTVQGVLEKRSIVPGARGLVRYVLGTAICSRCANAAALDRSTWFVRRPRKLLFAWRGHYESFRSFRATAAKRFTRSARKRQPL